jgi:hypothetical protein
MSEIEQLLTQFLAGQSKQAKTRSAVLKHCSTAKSTSDPVCVRDLAAAKLASGICFAAKSVVIQVSRESFS